MDLGTVTLVIVGTIAGMAGLIKTMVLSRLDQIHAELSGLTREHYRLANRVTTLETEHRLRSCITGCTPVNEEVR